MIPPSELKPKPAKMNLTPMIDVVFLLIIFFVVSNTMMQRERSMPIDLPSAAAADDDTESQTGKIIINIDAAGKLYYGAAEVTG
ncbi:MAG: biopolymer transporter ExbD, partial [Thermoguttaceae bacterium]|nr:biopolymer transporter ExbD [Thermoguttaceae bacterium]